MVSTLVLIYFGRPRLGHKIKTNFIIFPTADPEICSILIFCSLGLASPQDFVYDFSINLSNFIVWLHFLLEIFGNMCIAIICCLVCPVISFEIKLNFIIKPISNITKKSGQKYKYFEDKKSF